jgi:hypothetical protein
MLNSKKENPAQIQNEQRSNDLQLVEIDHNKFAVELHNGNVSVNLSKMAKPFGKSKQPSNWLKTTEAKEYLNAVSVPLKVGTADLLQVRQGGRPEEQGTWTNDYRIAMRFAQWLSPEFSIKVDEAMISLLTGNNPLKKESNQLSENASAFQERTVITTYMGETICRIWVEDGVIYACLSEIIKYIEPDKASVGKYVGPSEFAIQSYSQRYER